MTGNSMHNPNWQDVGYVWCSLWHVTLLMIQTGRRTRLLQRSDATSLEGHKSFRPLLPHIWGDTAFPYMSSSLQVWCIKMIRSQYSMDLASSWSGESTRGGWASFWAGGLAGVLSWQVWPTPPQIVIKVIYHIQGCSPGRSHLLTVSKYVLRKYSTA